MNVSPLTRSIRGPVKALVAAVVATALVVAATTAYAASRDQRWTDVMTGFNSQTWYTTSSGNTSFTRYTCSTNYPSAPNTTFVLYHQRGGLPDENKGNLITSKPCNGTNVSGSAYSNDTQNHYWKLNYGQRGGEAINGTGRTTYPG